MEVEKEMEVEVEEEEKVEVMLVSSEEQVMICCFQYRLTAAQAIISKLFIEQRQDVLPEEIVVQSKLLVSNLMDRASTGDETERRTNPLLSPQHEQ